MSLTDIKNNHYPMFSLAGSENTPPKPTFTPSFCRNVTLGSISVVIDVDKVELTNTTVKLETIADVIDVDSLPLNTPNAKFGGKYVMTNDKIEIEDGIVDLSSNCDNIHDEKLEAEGFVTQVLDTAMDEEIQVGAKSFAYGSTSMKRKFGKRI